MKSLMLAGVAVVALGLSSQAQAQWGPTWSPYPTTSTYAAPSIVYYPTPTYEMPQNTFQMPSSGGRCLVPAAGC